MRISRPALDPRGSPGGFVAGSSRSVTIVVCWVRFEKKKGARVPCRPLQFGTVVGCKAGARTTAALMLLEKNEGSDEVIVATHAELRVEKIDLHARFSFVQQGRPRKTNVSRRHPACDEGAAGDGV